MDTQHRGNAVVGFFERAAARWLRRRGWTVVPLGVDAPPLRSGGYHAGHVVPCSPDQRGILAFVPGEVASQALGDVQAPPIEVELHRVS